MNLTGPRCLHPMQNYELRRYPGQPPELFPVCWRPRGHPEPGRHLSRRAIERDAERKRGYPHRARPSRAAEMTDPAVRLAT